MIEKRILVGWLVGLIVLGVVAGCADTSTCKNHREGIPALYSEDFSFDTFWIGTLGIEELMVVGANASHDTSVHADFTDFTNYQVMLATRDEYPPSCIIYTGRPPDPTGKKQPLNVTSVTVKGLTGGDRTINPNGSNPLIEGRAFDSDQVSFIVASGTGADDFPGFDDSINAPVFPKLLRLGDLSSLDLSTGPSLGITFYRADPFYVQWKPSNADYIEIVLMPGTGTQTGYAKLLCIAFDDGCLEIPADAIATLALDTCTNFRFRIERHNFKSHLIMDGETTKAAALIDVSSVLEAIVTK